ncbi:MAG: amidohydrolase [Acidobacteria bacterium]|nr:amidohydrolase [Acidobacteriota bacterium]
MESRVDVFCHILPKRYDAVRWERVEKTNFVKHSPSHLKYVAGGKSMEQENVNVLMDLDARWRMMDEFPNYRQVISVASPPIEAVDPDDSEYLAKILNDEMAELVQKYPDRFAGAAASLPMNNPEASARELERCIMHLKLCTVQLFSNVNGKPLDLPQFRPVFEICSKANLPILLHPARSIDVPDYASENDSKFIIWQIFGWPYETTAAMARLACGGVLEDFPNLKIICHHSGAMVPFFQGRMKSMYRMFEPLIAAERGGRPFSKPILEYFRLFYTDVSTFTTASIECAADFFGVDHVLFGTDAPFDIEGGRASIRESTEAIEKSRFSAAEKSKIFHGNFESYFRVPALAPARA